jgi:hypothetical protein
VNEIALAFVQDARHRGELCRPLDWIPAPHRGITDGQGLFLDALLPYRTGPGGRGPAAQALVDVDRATAEPGRLGARPDAWARLHTAVQARSRPCRGCCSSWTAPQRPGDGAL